MSKFNRFNKDNRQGQKIGGDSLTQQHMAAEADINNLVNRHLNNPRRVPLGDPHATRQAQFGDYTSMDFQAMQNAVADIEQKFAGLPARLRARFQNQPYQLVRFVENEENREEALKMGLIEPEFEDVFEEDFDKETPAKPAEEPHNPLKADPEANPQHGGKPLKTPEKA